MLSRRNVRIKVMQVLYAASRDKIYSKDNALRFYRKMIDDSFALFLLNLVILMRVSSYAKQDKITKNQKLRPSEADRSFSSALADNQLATSLQENTQLTVFIQKYGFPSKIDADTVRKLYMNFGKEEPYQNYQKKEEKRKEDHLEVLLELYKFLYKDDVFTDMLEDHFPLWADDKSLVVGAMKKAIKGLPAEELFLEAFFPDDETVKDFGEHMLLKTLHTNDELLELIQPNLKNWDADRVAIMDMILIKMALVEFLYFPTIPTKVTINEIVELAKKYSTDKSKDFVNGILDRLQREMIEKGLINKKGRGLVED